MGRLTCPGGGRRRRSSPPARAPERSVLRGGCVTPPAAGAAGTLTMSAPKHQRVRRSAPSIYDLRECAVKLLRIDGTAARRTRCRCGRRRQRKSDRPGRQVGIARRVPTRSIKSCRGQDGVRARVRGPLIPPKKRPMTSSPTSCRPGHRDPGSPSSRAGRSVRDSRGTPAAEGARRSRSTRGCPRTGAWPGSPRRGCPTCVNCLMQFWQRAGLPR